MREKYYFYRSEFPFLRKDSKATSCHRLLQPLSRKPSNFSRRILYSQIKFIHQIIVLKIAGGVLQHDSAGLQKIAP
jgi:hypothetical protein